MHKCTFCNNEYKFISILNKHKKTAKKCKSCDFKTTVKNTILKLELDLK